MIDPVYLLFAGIGIFILITMLVMIGSALIYNPNRANEPGRDELNARVNAENAAERERIRQAQYEEEVRDIARKLQAYRLQDRNH